MAESFPMRKNLYGRIIREQPKEQHLNTVPKSCSFHYIWFHANYKSREKNGDIGVAIVVARMLSWVS